jgi:hypothetical protein
VRLVTFLLTGALALTAQTPPPNSLPWKSSGALPWQTDDPAQGTEPLPLKPTQSFFSLTVRVADDGTLRITDDKGVIRMRLGLPGRPLKAWRDWGTPVPDLRVPLRFAARSPLQLGIGGLPVGATDFRPALEGLLWILDDGESVLTVIHPATSQVVYLPLPGGQDMSLAFHPDRLEVLDAPAQGEQQLRPTWSLYWLALLPQFIQLGKDDAAGRPKGTALLPFPRE